MLEAVYQRQFIRDLEKAEKRGQKLNKLKDIMKLLLEGKSLPVKNKNHKLKGNYLGSWECHIEPDWLLIYQKTPTAIIFVRMGSHSDLF